MKKLMFAIGAVALCGAVFATDEVASQIVGFNVQAFEPETEAGEMNMYPMFGACFLPIGNHEPKLSEFRPKDGTMNLDSDNIQVIDPESLDASLFLQYCDETTAVAVAPDFEMTPEEALEKLTGWWDALEGFGVEGARKNDEPIVPGFGYMGYFFGGNTIEFQSAGEVPTDATSFDTDGLSPYPSLVNYLPVEIQLGQFRPADGTMNLDSDNLQIIDPNTLDASAFFQYCDETTAVAVAPDFEMTPEEALEKLTGWWDALEGFGVEGARRNALPVKAGQGFMGFFFAYSPITFQLPSALEKGTFVDDVAE